MYRAVVIGASAGGIDAILELLDGLNKPFDFPMIITIHLSANFESGLAKILSNRTGINCIEIEDKMDIEPNTIYISPPNYHTLVEKNNVFSLSITDKVCYARPSIDVMFETASDAYRDKLIGILLTGANHDGTNGLIEIKKNGGFIVVQDPDEAATSEMPLNAIKHEKPDKILKLREITKLLNELLERI